MPKQVEERNGEGRAGGGRKGVSTCKASWASRRVMRHSGPDQCHRGHKGDSDDWCSNSIPESKPEKTGHAGH